MGQIGKSRESAPKRVAESGQRKDLKNAAQKSALKEQLKRTDYAGGKALLQPGKAGAAAGAAGAQARAGGQPEGIVSDVLGWFGGLFGGGDKKAAPADAPADAPKPKRVLDDHPNADTIKTKNGEDTTYSPAYEDHKGTPFIKEEDDSDEIAMDDVAQGRLGDCYFVAALGSIAHRNPDAIREMIKDNGDGTYTVTFHEGGAVVVDSQFPTDGGKPAYARVGDKNDAEGSELWVMLIEKAWAKLKGGYEVIRGSRLKMSSRDAMEAVTGNKTTSHRTASMTDEELLEAMATADENKLPMTAGAYPTKHFDEKQLDKMSDQGIHANHAYSVVSVDKAGGKVELFNPWGKRYDHSVLTIAEVREYFRTVKVNDK